jgi:prevent-host-death family protein
MYILYNGTVNSGSGKEMAVATMNVAEARKQFSELVARVAYTGERVLVERRGKPMVAIVGMEDLKRLESLTENQNALRRQRQISLELAAASRAQIAHERNGVPLPDSAELLNQLREERDHELSGLR